MSAYTKVGSALWDWEPWTELTAEARILWLGLYTSAEAKRNVPGLWQGGIPTMADASRLQPDVVLRALDMLLERELVEFDPKVRVLRLCELPDAAEWPTSDKVILSWWRRFQSVPACAVRDAHVRTIMWLVETGSLESKAGKVGEALQTAWSTTFARVEIPVPRRRGVRRLADSDTATSAQPSLFPTLNASSLPAGKGMSIPGESSYPQGQTHAVDNSDSLRQLNDLSTRDRVSDRVCDRVSDTLRIRIPDPDLLSSYPEIRSGDPREIANRAPTLTLVPEQAPYTAEQVFAELRNGPWDQALEKPYREAVGALIRTWDALGVGVAQFAVLAQYNAISKRTWDARRLVGCDILAELSTAQRTVDMRAERQRILGEKLG